MSTIKTLAIALLAAGALSACNSSDDSSNNEKASKSASHNLEGVSNIRFYNLDTISVHYDLINDLNKEYEVTLKNYQTEETKKRNELQSLATKIEEKARSGGYLTQQSYEADMTDFQKKQQQAENYLATLQSKLMDQAASQQQLLLDSLNSFLKDYNEVNQFDAILSLTLGSCCNPDLNITDEIVEGLNARYKAGKK